MWILCLAEDSLEVSSLIFSEKQWKKYLRMSSAAVVFGALRVKNDLKTTCFTDGPIHWTLNANS